MSNNCCQPKGKGQKRRPDYLLWGSTLILGVSYFCWLVLAADVSSIPFISTFSQSIFNLLNRMAWGMLIGILFVGALDNIPRDLIAKIMGQGGTFSGILRATLAGVLLDLCSHGILLVGMKLYQRGISLGQTMAFLIASPWNSLSLTLILWALVGLKWTLALLVLSMLIAIISGLVFDKLVAKGILEQNPNQLQINDTFSTKESLKDLFHLRNFHPLKILQTFWQGLKGSRMILRWIFFGTIFASLFRTFLSPESFQALFGPTLGGLGLTLLVATILEVCSEGSTPIAADILTNANAPGNAFAFLMTGISTDYTEILSLKETTGSWKTAFFLPLVTLPQVIIISILINGLK